MAERKKIKFGIPGGSLEESIKRLLKGAGYNFEITKAPSRVVLDDPSIEPFFDKANEIARLVDRGVLDGGIVSKAAILEARAKVKELFVIGTPSTDWVSTKVVLAVPKGSRIKSVNGLKGKKIITRLPEITKDFLKNNKISAEIETVSSSVESKAKELADALVEFTNTGATLKFYRMRVIDILLEDANILSVIASQKAASDKWKREKMEDIGMLLEGARTGQDKVGLMLHASNDMMAQVLENLPSLKKPTVTHLRGQNWFQVFTVGDRKEIRDLIPKLKKIGCEDIVEFSLNKVVL